MSKSKGLKLLICVDQFFAVLIFNTDEDQTISGYVGYKAHTTKSRKFKFLEKFINLIFSPWEKNHCYNSIEWDRIK